MIQDGENSLQTSVLREEELNFPLPLYLYHTHTHTHYQDISHKNPDFILEQLDIHIKKKLNLNTDFTPFTFHKN